MRGGAHHLLDAEELEDAGVVPRLPLDLAGLRAVEVLSEIYTNGPYK